jgi:hypothetical protein
MGGAEGCDAAEVMTAERLYALGAAIAALRRRMAAGESPDPTTLQRLLEGNLSQPLQWERHPAPDGPRLAVLDELSGLIGELERERDVIQARMRAWLRARQVDASYGTTGRSS